ncbi:DUF3570 domain-containing protein [Thalassotalea sp. Y01]|uniref:DUF3570 domain-containing protein n=1 Tax=Thalassotalea sp. Y01 TaxID=2729613 RepID=UPI00145C9CB1|nr:DUF3570 domain-containing protein [Thalassotalea sp. Y01]NMP15613.1 DUF3570 domain-containing protein [Thalassotalea sp. Y01]
MQLKDDSGNKVKAILGAAACSLLGSNAKAQQDAWQIDTAVLLYAEEQRVSVVEGIVSATKDFGDQHIFNGKITADTLSGASANGAVPQPYVQTFARPSGDGVYQVDANETPLDPTFHDTRLQLNASWSQPFSADYRYSVAAHASKEYDYFSLGVSGSIARDFNKKNTTLAFGLGAFFDQIDPEGGIPKPLAILSQVTPDSVLSGNVFTDLSSGENPYRIAKDDDKTTIDVLFGVTQVLSRRAIVQFNYSYSSVDGYLNDAFKIVSLVDEQGISQAQIYESRPDTRQKQSVFAQSKYHLEHDIIDVSYRYMWDDWQINSHTFDLRYRIQLNGRYLEPHVRYYEQQEGEFFQPFVTTGQWQNDQPKHVSADYRLGKMSAFTLGFKYGILFDKGREWSFRLQYYQQDPDNPGVDAPGVLAEQDLYESVKAIIFQVSNSF